MIGAAFLAFILLTSNPFEPVAGAVRGPRPQPDPAGPRPRHPSAAALSRLRRFSIVFSFAAAALIEGRIDAAWARYVRPFALIAWSFPDARIAVGSYWAYYTLAGRLLFWDPSRTLR